MPNHRIDEDDLHTARVGCRLTEAERDRLKAEAEAHGLTLSQVARARIVGVRLKSRIDSKAIAELRRQGGLLKHLAQTTSIDRALVGEALREVIAAIRRVG